MPFSLVSALAIGVRGGVFSLTLARLSLRLRNKLFRSLMRQEIGFFDANHTGLLLHLPYRYALHPHSFTFLLHPLYRDVLHLHPVTFLLHPLYRDILLFHPRPHICSTSTRPSVLSTIRFTSHIHPSIRSSTNLSSLLSSILLYCRSSIRPPILQHPRQQLLDPSSNPLLHSSPPPPLLLTLLSSTLTEPRQVTSRPG